MAKGGCKCGGQEEGETSRAERNTRETATCRKITGEFHLRLMIFAFCFSKESRFIIIVLFRKGGNYLSIGMPQ